MSKALAVCIGDVHYSLSTLALADNAMRQAIARANELNVPLVANGDIHDSKANLRGECVNAMLETFKLCKVKPYVNIGNHSRINAKSKEHSLNFLAPYAKIVDEYMWAEDIDSFIISYQDDPNRLKQILKNVLPGTKVFLHQGVKGSDMGEYVLDHSAIDKECLADFRTILSHYHKRQDVKCGRPRAGSVGLASYIGSPYSISFGEANDGPKGFSVLMEDGSLEFRPTNLRKHVVIEATWGSNSFAHSDYPAPGDLLWIKVTGTKEQLATITKNTVREWRQLPKDQDFRLDLIPTDTTTEAPETANKTDGETLDALIDSLTNTSDDRKERLKELWKKSVCG